MAIDLFADETLAVEITLEGERVIVVGETALLVPSDKFGMTWMEQDRGREILGAPTRVIFDIDEVAGVPQLTITNEDFEHIESLHQDHALVRNQDD